MPWLRRAPASRPSPAALGLTRERVRKIIAAVLTAGYGPRPHKETQLQPFEPYLRERLAAVHELIGRRLHGEFAALGYRGGYTAVTDLLREIRPVVPPPFELRFETPQQQAEVRLRAVPDRVH